MFYPAINFDLKSFRFLTSDYGRQIRKKKESELFPLADYKLYVINNKEAFQTLELQVVGLANYLYDLSRPLKLNYTHHANYYRRGYHWRWQQHRGHTEEEENYSSLKDYLIQNLEELDRIYYNNMDARKIVWKYMDWASNSYLPDNFIGYNRVWLKEFILYFKKDYEKWKVNSGRTSINSLSLSTYKQLDVIFLNAKKYYRDNHYAIKLRKQDNFDVRLATERSEDAIKLLRQIRVLWSGSRKGVYGVQPAELNELLFEMGMDDRLPVWDPMVCQKCEGEGFTVHRSKRRCLKCKGYGYNNPNRIYPIRYQGTYSERELSELNRDAYPPFYRTSDAYGRKSQLEIPQIDEMRTLLNIAESINSREA